MPGPSSVNLYMGQGVATDLSKCSLTSFQFFTCAPVVFYNEQTKKGALYHFPGLDHPHNMNANYTQAIMRLCKEVNPTQVYVLAGEGDVGTPPKLMIGHMQIVTDLVKKAVHGVQVHYEIPQGSLVGDVPDSMKKPHELGKHEVPEDFDIPSPTVSSIGSLTISADAGGLKFGPYHFGVDISLETERDVANLLASTGDTRCFVGDPNANRKGRGNWETNAQDPSKLNLDKSRIAAMREEVDKMKVDFYRNLPPKEQATYDLSPVPEPAPKAPVQKQPTDLELLVDRLFAEPVAAPAPVVNGGVSAAAEAPNNPQAPQSVAAALGRARPQQVDGGAQVSVDTDGSNTVRAQFKRSASNSNLSGGPTVKL